MSTDDALTSRMGSLWVFPDGPNRAGFYLGCIDSGDIVEPQGDVALLQCFDENGEFKTVGETESPPGPVTADLTSLVYSHRNYLERLRGEYGLVFLERDGGRADQFTNWERAVILDRAWHTSKSWTGIVKREADDQSKRRFGVSSDNPVIKAVTVHGVRLPTTEPTSIFDIAMLTTGTGIYPVRYGVKVCAADAGAKANIYVTDDGGHTWTVCTDQPFAINENITACCIVDMGNGNRRLIVNNADATEIGYSDDDGTNWAPPVTIGKCVSDYSFFALDAQHIWAACEDGYILFSSDAGESWVTQEAGVITTDPWASVFFLSDGATGFVIEDAATGRVGKTTNGGLSWYQVGAIADTASSIHSVDGDTVWATGALGLYYSEDGGVMWGLRTGVPLLAATDFPTMVQFINRWVGYCLVTNIGTTASYLLRTIDGGWTWERITTPANDYLEVIRAYDENYVLVCGNISSATGWIGIFEE